MACYNLPEWVFVNKHFSPMILLISARKGKQPKKMQVYWELAINELMSMWQGFYICDVLDDRGSTDYKPVRLQALLLWVIHDYPAYAKTLNIPDAGYCGCMVHGPEWGALYFSPGKMVYLGHCTLLDQHDPARPAQAGPAPPEMDHARYLAYCEELGVQPEVWGKLPYWRNLLIRHLVDEFHLGPNCLLRIVNCTSGK